MTRIDIISGFLGAGKTTLIKKLLSDALKGQQVVLIENEFGEIGIDGGFLKEAGIEIREMNSGCICCSLVGDFGTALREVIDQYHPDRIIIEPSGVGKLSDVIHAVEGVKTDADVVLNCATTVVDVTKCKIYLKNFGEFFKNQVEAASTVILSRTDTPKATPEKVEEALKLIRELNPDATVITTPVEELGGKKVLDTMEGVKIDLSHVEEEHEEDECGCHGHHHEHEEHGHEHHHEHEEHGMSIITIMKSMLTTTTMTMKRAVMTITTTRAAATTITAIIITTRTRCSPVGAGKPFINLTETRWKPS